MKTALEWFEQLPEPIRTKAINNWVYKRLDEYGDEDTFKSLDEAIGSIDWDRTNEGWHYWVDLHIDAQDGNFPNLHGWIPVSERLPTVKDADEKGKILAVTLKGKKLITVWYIDPDLIQFWQPLPKLPEVQNV